MLKWKRLLVLEELENECLTKIGRAAFDKMGSKSTLDLRIRNSPKATARK